MKPKTPATTHGGPIGSEQRSPNWGGAREGSGRKKGYKAPPNAAARTHVGYFRVTSHVGAELDTAAHLDGVLAADIVSDMISKRFKCPCADCKRARKNIPKAKKLASWRTLEEKGPGKK